MIEKKSDDFQQVTNIPLLIPDMKVDLKDLRAYLYCRIAHKDKNALEIQKKKLLQYAETSGVCVVGCAAEYTDGFNTQRRALEDVNQAVMTDKTDIVLVLDGSRISRNIQHLCEYVKFLSRYSVILYSVQEKAAIGLAS